MDSLKSAGNYVSDKVSGAAHKTSKEANKEVAKDPNVPIGTRARAAGDAVGDKFHEHGDKASAEANKQRAMH
ncbi:glucose-repressible protein grg1 domain-containing protein [Sarocladium implicatum]|nr:glucose-repressible protein grg1 domain-containing protein [Sarocladium implicatum]